MLLKSFSQENINISTEIINRPKHRIGSQQLVTVIEGSPILKHNFENKTVQYTIGNN